MLLMKRTCILQCEMIINCNCSTRFDDTKEEAIAIRSTALLEAEREEGISFLILQQDIFHLCDVFIGFSNRKKWLLLLIIFGLRQLGSNWCFSFAPELVGLFGAQGSPSSGSLLNL